MIPIRELRHFTTIACTALVLAGTAAAQHQGSPATSGQDLRGQDLTGRDLQGADLSRANIQGGSLRGANLDGANLAHARLERANLERASLKGADLSFAGLQSANLAKANLEGARLTGADLRGAHLAGANLRDVRDLANLHGADFSGSDLRGTDLMNVDATDLRSIKLQGALHDATTRWPRGFDVSKTGAKLAAQEPSDLVPQARNRGERLHDMTTGQDDAGARPPANAYEAGNPLAAPSRPAPDPVLPAGDANPTNPGSPTLYNMR